MSKNFCCCPTKVRTQTHLIQSHVCQPITPQGSVFCCLKGLRTPTFLLQRQACYRLHHETIFKRTTLKQKTQGFFGFGYISWLNLISLVYDKTSRLNIPLPPGSCLPVAWRAICPRVLVISLSVLICLYYLLNVSGHFFPFWKIVLFVIGYKGKQVY